jgi:hypothetical protein
LIDLLGHASANEATLVETSRQLAARKPKLIRDNLVSCIEEFLSRDQRISLGHRSFENVVAAME